MFTISTNTKARKKNVHTKKKFNKKLKIKTAQSHSMLKQIVKKKTFCDYIITYGKVSTHSTFPRMFMNDTI